MRFSLLAPTAFIFCFAIGAQAQQQSPAEDITPDLDTRIRDLVKQLDDDDSAIRQSATEVLMTIGIPAKKRVEAAQATDDAEVIILCGKILKVIAVRERVKFSDGLVKWFPAIYGHLATDDSGRKVAVLQRLTEMDENKKPKHIDDVTIDDIVAVIGELFVGGGKGLSPEQKASICGIACGCGSGGEKRRVIGAAPHLRPLLKDDNAGVRACAAHAVGELGDREAIPALKELLKEKETGVRAATVESLVLISGKEAIDDVKEMLKDPDAYIRGFVGMFLVEQGTRDGVAVEDVKQVLWEEAYGRRAEAVLRTLGVSDDEIKKFREQGRIWATWKKHFRHHLLVAHGSTAEMHREIDRFFFDLDEQDPDDTK